MASTLRPNWPLCVTTSGELYLDSSALVKLVQREAESDASGSSCAAGAETSS